MTIGEATAVIGVAITLLGIFVRYGIVLPMKNAIQPLEFSITDLTESLSESKSDRKDIHSQLRKQDIRITIQEQESKNVNKKLDRIEKKLDQLGR